jgi:hypothetical protein
MGQGLDLLLVFGGEYQVKDATVGTVRNLSAAVYVGNFQVCPTHTTGPRPTGMTSSEYARGPGQSSRETIILAYFHPCLF